MGSRGPASEIALEDTPAVFEHLDPPSVPLTAAEVADDLECTRRTASGKIESLADRGELLRKRTGTRSRAWWRPTGVGPSDERLDLFASVASPDLRERLRVISSYLQLLGNQDRDELDAEAREYLDAAVDGADRLDRLIDALFDYSRVGTRADLLGLTDCDAVVDRVLADLQQLIGGTDAEVVVDSLPTVVADERQPEQRFRDLVSNAIEVHDDEAPRVEIDAERRDDEWLFREADDGIGIDPGRSDGLFGAFSRRHTREEYPGAGIGLARCRKIVDRHGGRIWAESEAGIGSIFFVALPIREADPGCQARPTRPHEHP